MGSCEWWVFRGCGYSVRVEFCCTIWKASRVFCRFTVVLPLSVVALSLVLSGIFPVRVYVSVVRKCVVLFLISYGLGHLPRC